MELSSPGESSTFTGFQFHLYLPEGISVVTDEDGFSLVELSSRTSFRKHSLDCVLQPDGSYMVLCYSTNLSPFSGDNGSVMTITLKSDPSISSGDYSVVLKDVVL
ncbi:MAG: hypothetical protein IJY78_02330, partial [Bacteroidaceae bacterium]|nr:hypothetical protein [Bacteroidaceae bacterium]